MISGGEWSSGNSVLNEKPINPGDVAKPAIPPVPEGAEETSSAEGWWSGLIRKNPKNWS